MIDLKKCKFFDNGLNFSRTEIVGKVNGIWSPDHGGNILFLSVDVSYTQYNRKTCENETKYETEELVVKGNQANDLNHILQHGDIIHAVGQMRTFSFTTKSMVSKTLRKLNVEKITVRQFAPRQINDENVLPF